MRHKTWLLLAFSLLAASASAATNTWIGGVSLDWYTPANWSENRVPIESDVVVVPPGLIVRMDSNAVFAALELSGGLEGDAIHVRTVLNWHLGTWNNGSIRAQLTIWPNAVVNIHSATNSYPRIEGTCVNVGTIRKLGPALLRVEGGNLINSGEVEVHEGTVELWNGLSSSGTFAIFDNAAVLLRGGFCDFAEGHRVMGDGRFAIAGDVVFHGMLRDRLDWLEGSLSGNLTVPSNGVLYNLGLLGAGTMVTNYGRVNLGVFWGSGTIFYNAPSGIVDMWGGEVQDGNGSTLINHGTIRCNAGWILLLHLDVEHYGSIEVTNSSHVMVRAGRFQSDGRISVEFGSVLGITDGTLALRERHSVTGDGLFGLYDDGYTDGRVRIEDWIYGRLDWAGAAMSGNIRIHSNAVLNLVDFPHQPQWVGHVLEGSSTITNYGTVNVSFAFGWPWGEHSSFYNAPSGVIEIIRSEQPWWMGHRGAVNTSLRNEGIIRTWETATLEFWMLFTNAGVLELRQPLEVWGFFAQTPAGSTVFHPDAASPLPLLSVSATAYLAGRLAVSLPDGTQPTAGTTFELMTFRDRVGEFQTFSGLGIAPGLRFDVLEQYKRLPYGDDGASISLRVVVPQNRASQPQLVNNAFTWTFDGDAERPYDIESSTNLVNWHRLYTTNSVTGQILFRDHEPFVLPHRFYRLRALP